jgi:Tfp pilus assembly protein FimT
MQMTISKTIPEAQDRCRSRHMKRRLPQQCGFSIVELAFVTVILLIVAGFAIPTLLTTLRVANFRGAISDFSGLLQTARIYAIRDNRFYSTYLLAASGSSPQQGYVDMLPKGTTGSSGNGGTSVAAGDPLVVIPSEVTERAAANAPNTSNLATQLLPSNTPVAPTDSTMTPITFGPRGLPCLVVLIAGGSVCNSLGGPAAYWIFFQDNLTSNWEAVTVTPAGRIQKWYYTGSAWNKL